MSMRIDRTLIGVVLIALVLSTVVTAFLVGERGEYSIVKEIRPRWIRKLTGKRYSFGLTLVAKQDIGSIRISHYSLMNRTDRISGFKSEGTPEEIAQRIPSIQAYLQATEGNPVLREISVHDVEIGKQDFELHLYDFSKVVWLSVPSDIMMSTDRPRAGITFLWNYYDVFACAFDKKGNLAYFYQGVADFFLNKIVSVKELFIERNDEKEVYYGVTEEGETQEIASSILHAPARGVLSFENLKRNDRIGVLFQVDGGGVPDNKGILHITAISADEGKPEFIYSPM